MTHGTANVSEAILLVQSEFLNRPGLRLTAAQAARHFGLAPHACDSILGTLADAGVIGLDAAGAYVRWLPRIMGTHPLAAYAHHAA